MGDTWTAPTASPTPPGRERGIGRPTPSTCPPSACGGTAAPKPARRACGSSALTPRIILSPWRSFTALPGRRVTRNRAGGLPWGERGHLRGCLDPKRERPSPRARSLDVSPKSDAGLDAGGPFSVLWVSSHVRVGASLLSKCFREGNTP
ncbi:unnamed protein product [Scytosiphon promiscuus]